MEDFKDRQDGLSADIIKITTPKAQVIFRPSGTEPKMKIYASAKEKNYTDARKIAEEAAQAAVDLLV
jgi:phosphomannomutase